MTESIYTEDLVNVLITEDSVNEIVLETATTVNPDPPTSLLATAITSDQIDLSWVEPVLTGTSPIIGYKIERESPVGGGFSTLVANTGSASVTYSDTGLTMNTEYNYRVSAINSEGTSTTSSTSSATTINIDPPTSLLATAITSDQIDLSWVAPVIHGGSTIAGYMIERETPVGGGFSTLVANTGSASVTYSDTGLTMNTQYNYRVSAITSLDTGDVSSTSSATTINIDPPTSLLATAISGTEVNLSWVAPVIHGGSTITGYMIERETPVGGGFSTLVANTGSASVTYSDNNLSSNTEYNYRVSAITSLDVGDASSTSSVTTLLEDLIRNWHGETFIKNISVTNTSKPTYPTYKILNRLQKTVEVFSLYLIPSRNFTQKGSISIEVAGRNTLVNLENSEILKDVGVFPVPLIETRLKANQSIKISIWNNTDTEQVSLKVMVGINKEFKNPDQFLRDQINEVKDEARITTGDGGTSKIIYTCPANKRAKVRKIVTRVSDTGSASKIYLKIATIIHSTWKVDSGNPDSYDTSIGSSYVGHDRTSTGRKVWNDGSYPEFNIPYTDGEGLVLESGETIKYDGNFSSTFNGTIDYFYSVIEETL